MAKSRTQYRKEETIIDQLNPYDSMEIQGTLFDF